MTRRSTGPAYYLRVSSKSQTDDSQRGDMERCAEREDAIAEYFTDTFTGKSMDRPAFNRMMAEVEKGTIKKIVVWRLDRLGRTAAGLCKLFEKLLACGCTLVSIKDGFDLTTASGRLMAHILASVAAYETEVRAERQRAGQQAAKAKGKRIGGSPPDRYKTQKAKTDAAVKALYESGHTPTQIGAALKLSKPCVYKSLERVTGQTAEERRLTMLREMEVCNGGRQVNGTPVAPAEEEE
jgi:DNA invertase Pin-like site-specific DNA recombinase